MKKLLTLRKFLNFCNVLVRFFIMYYFIFNRQKSTEHRPNSPSSDFTSFLDMAPSSPLAFQCSECNQSFSVSEDLELHKATHSTSGEFVCIQCNKQFAGMFPNTHDLYIKIIYKYVPQPQIQVQRDNYNEAVLA